MNISCNRSGFFPSSPLTPDDDPGDDECLGLWLSLHFSLCGMGAGGRCGEIWNLLPEKQQPQKLFHLQLHGIFSHERSAGESLFAR